MVLGRDQMDDLSRELAQLSLPTRMRSARVENAESLLQAASRLHRAGCGWFCDSIELVAGGFVAS